MAPVLPSAEGLAPYFKDWLAHPNFDEYWKQISIEEHYAQIQVPVYGMGAWYDIFLGGTLENYMGLKAEAGTGAARDGERRPGCMRGHPGGTAERKNGALE